MTRSWCGYCRRSLFRYKAQPFILTSTLGNVFMAFFGLRRKALIEQVPIVRRITFCRATNKFGIAKETKKKREKLPMNGEPPGLRGRFQGRPSCGTMASGRGMPLRKGDIGRSGGS